MPRNYFKRKSSRSFQQARNEWRDLVGAWSPWSGRLHSTSRGAKQFIYWFIYRFIYRFIYQFISLRVYIEKYKLFSCYWSWMAVCTQGRYNWIYMKQYLYICKLACTHTVGEGVVFMIPWWQISWTVYKISQYTTLIKLVLGTRAV